MYLQYILFNNTFDIEAIKRTIMKDIDDVNIVEADIVTIENKNMRKNNNKKIKYDELQS